VARLLYPFLKESVFGQFNWAKYVWRQRGLLGLALTVTCLFFTTISLSEQNVRQYERIQDLKNDASQLAKAKADLDVRNSRLLGLLKGDIDEVCYAHIFGKKPDLIFSDASCQIFSALFLDSIASGYFTRNFLIESKAV
jgi:hypothetical protein